MREGNIIAQTLIDSSSVHWAYLNKVASGMHMEREKH
jgi:hypothetical protein